MAKAKNSQHFKEGGGRVLLKYTTVHGGGGGGYTKVLQFHRCL